MRFRDFIFDTYIFKSCLKSFLSFLFKKWIRNRDFHFFFRVDFLPAPKGGQVKNPRGCLRCGYSVYEAEKLIAAGRVSNLK